MKEQDEVTELSVLIADDHMTVGEGLERYLARYYSSVELVHELSEVRSTVDSTKPDVVVLDLCFPEGSSLPTMRKVRREHPTKPVFIILTQEDSNAVHREALNLGAVAVLLKTTTSLEQLRRTIDSCLQNGHPSQEQEPPKTSKGRAVVYLTIGGIKISQIQAEIVLLLCDGLARETIATHRGIRVGTVDFHLDAARRRVGVRSTRLLIRWGDERREEIEEQL